MLHSLFNRLENPVAMGIVANRLCGHALIEADDERVHCYTDSDHTKATDRDVGYAEREYRCIGHHQQGIAHGLNLIPWEPDVFKDGLDS
jgi:hypothetical protein